jgi:hypothetical protein
VWQPRYWPRRIVFKAEENKALQRAIVIVTIARRVAISKKKSHRWKTKHQPAVSASESSETTTDVKSVKKATVILV